MLVVSSALPLVALQEDPESKMLEEVIKEFRDLTKKRGLSWQEHQAHRQNKLRRVGTVLKSFRQDIHDWHKRWAGLTGMNMRLPDGLGEKVWRIGLVFGLFLFYVEMITTIVPRRSPREPPVDLPTELYQARKAFVLLSDLANQPLDPSTVMEPQLKRVVTALAKHWNPTPNSEKSTLIMLWDYLDYYLCTFRPSIFHVDPCKAVKTTVKSFFHKVFTYSYAHLRLVHVPRPNGSLDPF
ncbi:hypothetical protein VP01_3463g1 [Puccinia sorghi]|uniref:Uncharacterized protein n=1 Tax=Puccinia sorghi TaxID=27349 RepID=A0A0L6UXY3_9BASI|nr:hypothetical protein VP01_3463g1 [Puccinia sorghi]